ncbi:hypothetical protein CR513_38940, partial [Mucuna pruriens]
MQAPFIPIMSMAKESRWWVIRDEEEEASNLENFDADLRLGRHASMVDFEDDEDNTEQRLIRTGPHIDSFNVEAFEGLSYPYNSIEFQILSEVAMPCYFLIVLVGIY